nr:hypothetical protein GTC16762_03680 [Pigmentibacter ruber]
MKIRIPAFFLFVFFQNVLFANQNKEYLPENYKLFFMKYLEENKEKYNTINEAVIHCEKTVCILNLKNDNQTIFRINAYFQDNFEGNSVVINSYYDNGSFFEIEVYTIEKALKRTKRWDLFKPSIDGSWLANERALLLRKAREDTAKAKGETTKKKDETPKIKDEPKKVKDDSVKVKNQQPIVEKKEEKKETETVYFKPSIDGSWLANERAALLRIARKKMNEGKP